MQRRTTLGAACALLATSALTWGAAAQAQQPGAAPRIAVTNLAYAQQVSEYFVAGTYQESSQMSAQGSYSSGHSHGMYGGSGSASGQPHSTMVGECSSSRRLGVGKPSRGLPSTSTPATLPCLRTTPSSASAS